MYAWVYTCTIIILQRIAEENVKGVRLNFSLKSIYINAFGHIMVHTMSCTHFCYSTSDLCTLIHHHKLAVHVGSSDDLSSENSTNHVHQIRERHH